MPTLTKEAVLDKQIFPVQTDSEGSGFNDRFRQCLYLLLLLSSTAGLLQCAVHSQVVACLKHWIVQADCRLFATVLGVTPSHHSVVDVEITNTPVPIEILFLAPLKRSKAADTEPVAPMLGGVLDDLACLATTCGVLRFRTI
jgi:hypothetical protein